jgi:hypothetical protein
MEETSPPLSRWQVVKIIMHFLMANTRDGIVLGSMVCLNHCSVLEDQENLQSKVETA